MADTQPVAPAAPNGNDPQNQPSGPTGAPAEQTPVAPTITLSDDQKNYLKGQGIAEDQLLSPEAVTKLITHAQTSQKAAADFKNKFDSISSTINPGPTGPTNPLLASTGPTQPNQEQPTATPQPQATQGLSAVEAFNLSSNLAIQFPELKEDFISGKIYQDMAQIGIPLMGSDGVNLPGLIAYAQDRQSKRALELQIEELTNKPGNIPDARAQQTPTVAEDAPMTKQIAQAILVQDPNHARAEEAKRFLQTAK